MKLCKGRISLVVICCIAVQLVFHGIPVWSNQVEAADVHVENQAMSQNKVSTTVSNFEELTLEQKTELFNSIRKEWVGKLTGGSDIDVSDPDISRNIDEILRKVTNEEGSGNWDTMSKEEDPEALWSGVSLNINKKTAPVAATRAYKAIRDLAIAYSMEGSPLKDNEELKNDIVRAMNWMHEYQYNRGTYLDGTNWWDWLIGIPQPIMDILILMYEEMPQQLIDQYVETVDYYVPNPHTSPIKPGAIESGANLLDKALVVALSGVISQDAEKLEVTRDSLSDEFLYTTSENGIYEDGSLIQHKTFAYTGGYGGVFIKRVADVFDILADTPWVVTDPNISNVYTWIDSVFEPLVYKGAFFDTVNGRGISRVNQSDHLSGRAIGISLLRLAESAPSKVKIETKRMVKEWVLTDTSFENYYSGLSLYETTLLKRLMQDESVERRGDLVHTHMYAAMDRVIQQRDNFAISIGMFSDRIAAFEFGNGENSKGWYTGIGMTSLYNNDLNHFSDGYWPTVDSYRLPGTTTDGSYRNPGNYKKYYNTSDWVGGTVLNTTNGVAGMEFSLKNSTGSELYGKKSWFLFDDELVAIGSNITNTGSSQTETIVENRKLNEAGTNKLVVDGQEMPTSLDWSEQMEDVMWAHMEGNESGSNIGFVFPSSENITGVREERTGSWSQINTGGPTAPIERNYLSLGIDHGTAPTDSDYEYVLLPGKTSEQTAVYAANPDIQVLENNEKFHAVKETKSHVTGVNFWESSVFSYFKPEKPVSLMFKENGSELSISIAEPTHKEDEVRLNIGRVTLDVTSQDPSIRVVQSMPYTILAIDTKSAIGKTHSITLKVDPNQWIDLELLEQMQTKTYRIPVLEDTFVRNGTYGQTNYGNKDTLEVREGNVSYRRQAFLKFDLSSIKESIDEVTLNVYGMNNDSSANSSRMGVHYIQDDTWKESEMKWISMPDPVPEAISIIPYGKEEKWRAFDLTTTVKNELDLDKMLSLALIESPEETGTSSSAILRSKEHAASPYLEVKTKVQGEVVEEITTVLTGPAYVENGTSFSLNYNLKGVKEAIYAHDFTINYDSTVLEFKSVVPRVDEITVIDTPKMNTENERVLSVNIGGTEESYLDHPLIMNFKVKEGGAPTDTSIHVSDIILANQAGIETSVVGATHLVSTQESKPDVSILEHLIADAQNKHDMAIEGYSSGQYPTGAKAILQAAIDKAQEVVDMAGPSQSDVDQAIADLKETLNVFLNSAYSINQGDLNQDNRYSIGDLAIVVAAYNKKSTDPDWEKFKAADINKDGRVDLFDLVIVARYVAEADYTVNREF